MLILISFVISITAGLVFDNYSVKLALIVVPFGFPALSSILASISKFRTDVGRFLMGATALGVFDLVRWITWVSKVGYDFAARDEQMYGMAKATIFVQILIYAGFFSASSWLRERIIRSEKMVHGE
ncbi:MAG: hypothetical protein AB2L11_10965 [Syntrophobacteraceae bacterium]